MQQQVQESERQAAAQRAADAESRRRFDVGTNLSEQQIGVEKQRYSFGQTQRDQADKKAMDQVGKMAEFMAPDVHEAGSNLEDSHKRYEDAMSAIDTKRSELQPDFAGKPVVYDKASKQFVFAIKGGVPDATLGRQIADANSELDKAKAQYDTAAATYSAHKNAFDTLQKQASGAGLQIGYRNGKWVVYSPAHDKTWGDKGTVETPAPMEPSDAQQVPFWARGQSFDLGAPAEQQAAMGAAMPTGVPANVGWTPPPAQSSMVRVRNPTGQTGSIPADQLDDALAAGYTQVK